MKALLELCVPSRYRSSELGRVLLRFRRSFLAVALISAVTNVLLLAPTLYLIQIFDRIMVSRNELTLLVISLITLFLLGVLAISNWTRARLLVSIGFHLDDSLGPRLFASGFERSLEKPGSTQMQAFDDLAELRRFLTGAGILAIFDAPWVPIFIGVLFLLHPFLGIAAVAFVAMQYASMWLTRRYTADAVAASGQARRVVNNFLTGRLRHAEVLHSMGMFESFKARWWQRHQRALEAATESIARTNFTRAGSSWMRMSQQTVGLALGAVLVVQGELSIGAMLAANMLMSRTLGPAHRLASQAAKFARLRQAAARLDSMLQPLEDAPATAPLPPITGRVELRNVSAQIPGTAKLLLENIDLKLEPGTLTVVIGASGSGKSTLARVVLGLWPSVQGDILLDGHPIQNWAREKLGPHIGYLQQDVELFEGSLAENIARMATPDPQAVVQAAHDADLHNMILRLPLGYETPMGETGHTLSGGQLQRLGLARAIYGSPELIVLDEPNAHLDGVGEAALEKVIRHMTARGKTVLLITHRQSVINIADRLVILEKGRILLQGPRKATWIQWQQHKRKLTTKQPAPARGPATPHT